MFTATINDHALRASVDETPVGDYAVHIYKDGSLMEILFLAAEPTVSFEQWHTGDIIATVKSYRETSVVLF